MARLVPALLLLAAPFTVLAEPPRAEGRIDTGDARVEILGRAYRVGETIQLPEGYIRVEEAGPEDEEIGSFSVVPATTFAASAGTGSGAETRTAAEPADAPRAEADAVASCRAERAAYLAEVMKASGIEIDDAASFLAAFEGTAGNPNVASLWFALSTDALRPLAWSSDARGRAAELARCMRAQ
jgi:hypothetical protein